MSDPSRALPDQPNLRFLKIEAKRRLAAGEFGTLHDAQLAIAREHGHSSWAALKAAVEATGTALVHVQWLTGRFGGADSPEWESPDDEELREHFDDNYLAVMHRDTMIGTLKSVATALREDLVVSRSAARSVSGRIGGLRLEAVAEPDPPHRLTALRLSPTGERVTDPRVAEPPAHTTGDVPDRAFAVARESFADVGLPGLVLAGSGSWSAAMGWADLDRGESLLPAHRFPAYGTTKVITATAVLCLVAQQRIGLDDPANAHLRSLRLGDDGVTVRELLTHTSGVVGPVEQFADRVPGDPVALLGSVVEIGERRGTLAPSNGGYAVLGQLLADVTGTGYVDAVARLVFEPLGMAASAFPDSWPDVDAVTGYHVAGNGTFERVPAQVCTMPAAGGLWTTAGDLLRFGTGWTTLLPDDLVTEALRSHVAQPVPGAKVALGWVTNPDKHLYGHPGTGPGGSVSLIVRQDNATVHVACTNRQVRIEPVNARLARPAD
jgi:CubicO group peptidase (beta-lactamase class C family)